jgi:hypothetical protein
MVQSECMLAANFAFALLTYSVHPYIRKPNLSEVQLSPQ